MFNGKKLASLFTDQLPGRFDIYKKMLMKTMKIIFTIFSSITIFSCDNPKSDKTVKKTETEILEQKSEISNLEKLEVEASRLRAGGSIKIVDFENGNATIEYVKDYDEYKKLNPQSGLTESVYNENGRQKFFTKFGKKQ